MWNVEWDEFSLDELAAAWNSASSDERSRITKGADAVDKQLSKDPFAESESRADNQRVMFCPPLLVTYQVENDGRTVTVLHVRHYHPRNQ
jgi:hypothetical protein